MPRVYAPRRTHVGYRENPEVLAALDHLAQEQGVERSDVLRAATRAYANQHVRGDVCQR